MTDEHAAIEAQRQKDRAERIKALYKQLGGAEYIAKRLGLKKATLYSRDTMKTGISSLNFLGLVMIAGEIRETHGHTVTVSPDLFSFRHLIAAEKCDVKPELAPLAA